MSNSQISYPVKLQLQTQEKTTLLSLSKGPQRETITLEEYNIRLVRSNNNLQPVITSSTEGNLRSLSLWIPLNDKYKPLFHEEEKVSFTTMLLKKDANLLQIYRDPKCEEALRIELCAGGTQVKLTWLLDRAIQPDKDLPLGMVQIASEEKKTELIRYSLKNPSLSTLHTGRLFSSDSRLTLDEIRKDVKTLSEYKCSFNLYMLDYGTASEWGDWEQPSLSFGDNFTGFADAARSLRAIPGIRFSPLTCSRKSNLYKNHRELLLEKGNKITVTTGKGQVSLLPLDITQEEVRNHIDKALNFYVSRGIKFIHLDHLNTLFDQADWADSTLDPQMRLQLLIKIMAPFKKRGVRFSASGLPLMGELDQFNVIFGDLCDPWNSISDMLNMSICLRNPPPLSLGRLYLKTDKKKKDSNKKEKLFLHTQTLLNGPAMLADKTEDLDKSLLESWKIWTAEKAVPLLPLELSEYGLAQDALLLMNRQKMTAILNLSKKTKVVRLKEGELAGSRGYSPSETTSLKSQELILEMSWESSHYFRV
jgi:hypothetical protein